MKISLNWAQYYSNTELKKLKIDDLVFKIGSQLAAVEEVIDWGAKYDGILVSKVISCVKHDNADKLNVCLIDDGNKNTKVKRDDKGLIQVVCGAPNVKVGLTVAWIPPGATVPSSITKDPFVLEAREIRGVVSNGMLASSSELGISDDHSGILEIDPDEVGLDLAKPGTEFKKLYALDDYIIDCENKMFTHRPDCFGILGIARELAGIQNKAFISPDWYKQPVKLKNNNRLPIKIQVDAPELVPRFTALTISNISVKPSPIWLQVALTKVGIRPINNIVDLTNFYMHLTGQPLHAYDYDKLKTLSLNEAVLVARRSKKGESVSLLNGKTLKLEDNSTIVIATNKQVVGIGGIMGGSKTEVDDKTRNIVLECASFDMYNIRRSSMKYGLFTDAVTRFTKGQSEMQNTVVISKIAEDILGLAGGEVASQLVDTHAKLHENKQITVEASLINSLLGSDLSINKIANLLRDVELIVELDDETIKVTPPFWRTDLHIQEDIVEEVGRLYGYDNLPKTLPLRNSSPVPKNVDFEIRYKIQTALSSAGANELLTYTFVAGNLLDISCQDKRQAFQLSNALSPELQYYRLSLTPSLLEKVHSNIKAGNTEFAIYEINKVHTKTIVDVEKLPKEMNHLAVVFAAENKTAKEKYSGAAYYSARKYLDYLLDIFSISNLRYVPLSEYVLEHDYDKQLVAPYEHSRSAVILGEDNWMWGVIGEYKSSVKRDLKLPDYIAGFEINTKLFAKLGQEQNYQPISRFPNITQDITLEVPASTKFDAIAGILDKEAATAAKTEKLTITVEPVDIFQKQNSKTKNLTFKLKLNNPERTLTTKEANIIVDSIVEKIETSAKVKRI